MKKLCIVIISCFFITFGYTQSDEKPRLLKYITTGPDGNVLVTVLDDSRKNQIEVLPNENVYKYQLKNIKTDEVLLTFGNNGKPGKIDRKILNTKDYTLIIYTKSFIITSDLGIKNATKSTSSIAMNEEN